MLFATECASHCSFWRDYTGLLTDGPHIFVELTVEVVTGGIGWVIGSRAWRRWVHKHDIEVHGHECDDDG